jgi:uncharacterized protein YehS (DUF1456 family)
MMMKILLHKWHWYWFKRHMKWLIKEWREQVYKELDRALCEIIKNTPIQYTEDVVIDLVKRVEHDDFIVGNKYNWTKFENGVIKIDKRGSN